VRNLDLDENLESYLVLLMMRFTEDRETGHRVMALDYLRGLRRRHGPRRWHCGTWATTACCSPACSASARVAGGSAWATSSTWAAPRTSRWPSASPASSLSDLFDALAHGFVRLSDVLRAMRELDGSASLSALEAMDLLAVLRQPPRPPGP
jgi:hypothetical protein